MRQRTHRPGDGHSDLTPLDDLDDLTVRVAVRLLFDARERFVGCRVGSPSGEAARALAERGFVVAHSDGEMIGLFPRWWRAVL